MMMEQQQKADQVAYHFYKKLFSVVHDARVTNDSNGSNHVKLDKWFKLESPDPDVFSKDTRDLYKSITCNTPPPLELEVILNIPDLAPNQTLVYLPPDSSRVRVEPTPKAIILEVWTVTLSGSENAGVTSPSIYKHGVALFRSIYTLLRTLPAWTLYKRIRRHTGGLARTSAFSISLRLRLPNAPIRADDTVLAFHQQPSPSVPLIPTLTQSFPPVQFPPGSLDFSVTYLATPYFQINTFESVLSSRFIPTAPNISEGFLPTPNNFTPRHEKRPTFPPKISELPRSSPRDPLARLREESVSMSTALPSFTGSPQLKQSLNSNPLAVSSAVSQGSEEEISADLPFEETIINLLQTQVLGSKLNYKTLLEMKGTSAQRILNIFQKLLDSPNMADDLARRSILMALLRLSAACGLYPQQLKLDDIQRDPSPVTAGQFGEVYKGQYKGRQICVKIFKLYQRSHIDHLNKYFSREAIVWGQLSHPNLLPFYGVYHILDPYPRIGLVSPWMQNGNLPEYLAAHLDKPRLPFVHDVLAGLQYLHQNQIVHGDLKGLNILVSEEGSACLADFGLSSVMDADILRWSSLETMTRAGGTVRWTAPEMIEGTEDGGPLRPTFASDVYSLASVMIEIFTGQIPYHEFPRDLTVLSKVNRGIRPTRPRHETAPELTDHIWAIMQDCWSDAPGDRPTVDEVIERLPEDEPSLPRLWAAQAQIRNNISAQRDSKLSASDIGFLSDMFNLGLV